MLSESFCAMTRAAISGAPPGGIGTMMVIGRDGNCAKALVAMSRQTTRETSSRARVFIVRGRVDSSQGVYRQRGWSLHHLRIAAVDPAPAARADLRHRAARLPRLHRRGVARHPAP